MTRLPCQRPHENGTLAPSSLAEGNAEQGRPQLGSQAQVRRLDVRDIGRVRGARTLKRISWLRRAVASCQMAGRLPSNSVKALLTAEATGPAPYLALSDLVPRPMPVSVRGTLLRFVPPRPAETIRVVWNTAPGHDRLAPTLISVSRPRPQSWRPVVRSGNQASWQGLAARHCTWTVFRATHHSIS